MLRGLFFVSIYGVIEYSVTEAVQNFITFLSSSRVEYRHLLHVLNVVALDPELSSARDAGEKKKWETRRAIFTPLTNQSICAVDNTVFGSFLHNVWPRTIEEIFLCLGINKPATPSPREVTYLKEIVEKRNAVAHGRETATDVGEGLTADELQKRLDATYIASVHVLDAIEEHAVSLSFVRPDFHAKYKTT